MKKNLALAATLFATLTPSWANAATPVNQAFPQAVKMKFCIFDIAGTKGDAYTMLKI
jgi:hypothetical protein